MGLILEKWCAKNDTHCLSNVSENPYFFNKIAGKEESKFGSNLKSTNDTINRKKKITFSDSYYK